MSMGLAIAGDQGTQKRVGEKVGGSQAKGTFGLLGQEPAVSRESSQGY